MPDTGKWEGCLPIFIGYDEESLAQHLKYFHAYMHQLGISHEYTYDVFG